MLGEGFVSVCERSCSCVIRVSGTFAKEFAAVGYSAVPVVIQCQQSHGRRKPTRADLLAITKEVKLHRGRAKGNTIKTIHSLEVEDDGACDAEEDCATAGDIAVIINWLEFEGTAAIAQLGIILKYCRQVDVMHGLTGRDVVNGWYVNRLNIFLAIVFVLAFVVRCRWKNPHFGAFCSYFKN